MTATASKQKPRSPDKSTGTDENRRARFQQIPLTHAVKWESFILHVLANNPSWICTQEEKQEWLTAKLTSLARIRNGRLETAGEVASRLDAASWRRAGIRSPRLGAAAVQISAGESQPIVVVDDSVESEISYQKEPDE